MKEKLVARIQSLGRQASQLRQVVEAAPAQAARLRESVVLTVGQLHQLRSEIQTGIAELRADNGDQQLRVLGEIRDSTGVIRQAGFELAGVDLEMGLSAGQRLLLLLRKVEEVPPATIRALVEAHKSRPALHGVLASLQRAVEFAETVHLPDLDFRQLTIAVGPIPTMRVGWRAESEVPPPVQRSATESPPVLSTLTTVLSSSQAMPPLEAAPIPRHASTPWAATAPTLAPIQPPAPSAPTQPEPMSLPPSPTPPASTAAKVLGAHWRANALDRFKKMPDLSKTP